MVASSRNTPQITPPPHITKNDNLSPRPFHWVTLLWSADHMWMTFGLSCLCVSVVMAGYDIHRSAWILTRVSVTPSPSAAMEPFSQCFSLPSIKPFTQQAYPIQPAVTTAISSETNSHMSKTVLLQSDVVLRFERSRCRMEQTSYPTDFSARLVVKGSIDKESFK